MKNAKFLNKPIEIVSFYKFSSFYFKLRPKNLFCNSSTLINNPFFFGQKNKYLYSPILSTRTIFSNFIFHSYTTLTYKTPLQLYKENTNFKKDERQIHILETLLNPVFFHIAENRPIHFKGVYLHGGVGSGKTMMMDLLHKSVVTYVGSGISHRTYFTQFMLNFHKKIHEIRHSTKLRDHDLFQHVLDNIIPPDVRILCFDEFQVTDIADAMILKRLFEGFFKKDIFVVITSNRAPNELYQNGINRDNFIPFIHLLEERLKISPLKDGPDYRLAGVLKDHMYISSGNIEKDSKKLHDIFLELTRNHISAPDFLISHGRTIVIPLAANGVMFANFDSICRAKMSSVDYSAICEQYHTIIMENIPILTINDLDAIRRFITFIDEVYQNKIQFICSAQARPEKLLQIPEDIKKSSPMDEFFAFDRTVSRLVEMQSDTYNNLKKKF